MSAPLAVLELPAPTVGAKLCADGEPGCIFYGAFTCDGPCRILARSARCAMVRVADVDAAIGGEVTR